MKTIAMAWELGGNLGHISSFLPIAKGLKRAGFNPILILSDVSKVESIYKDENIQYIQAPVWQSVLNKDIPQENFTDSLFHFGYLDNNGLLAMTKAWVNLLKLINPDVLIADFAPTAILASKMIGLPVIAFGNSFSIPPKQSPMPPYQFWSQDQVDWGLLKAKEARCLSTINYVVKNFSGEKINAVYELYDVNCCLITTDKLLDVYGDNRDDSVEYIGAINTSDIGCQNFEWPLQSYPKVFVYIKPFYKNLQDFLYVISRVDAQFIIYCPGISKEIKTLYEDCLHIIFSEQPVHIGSMQKSCDCAIVHGGNLMDKFLEVGIPLLVLPIQMEQLMMSYVVQSRGVGLTFHPSGGIKKLQNLVREFLTSTALKINAKVLSNKFLKLNEQQQVEKVVAQLKFITE